MKVKFLFNLIFDIAFLAIIPVAYFTDYGVGYAVVATLILSVSDSFINDRQRSYLLTFSLITDTIKTMKNKYLSLKSASKYLDCDIKTLRIRVLNGTVPFLDCTKPGSKYVIRRFDTLDLDKAKDTF